MDIASVFKRYALEGDGQLALKFTDVPHLCKIAIEDGEAVFIKMGVLSPEETLLEIANKTLIEANFIKGFKVRKRLPKPITDQLMGTDSTSINNNKTETMSTKSTIISSGRFVSAQNISRMINHYVDIVGPLGVVMMENYLKALDRAPDKEMDSNSYNELLEKVLLDLPETDRAEFFSKHG
ncbi:MAG: hypothetical protein U9R29_08225 [Thermodesulfobacteriota bacterium]|nr:hypothetical protein [Thermodesulfobacteriota bacterium]